MRTHISVVAAAATLTAMAPPAAACGGFFCSTATPVDQSGEQIIFDMSEPGSVRMHIRVQYEGPAAQFAWVLPIPKEHPDEPLSIGSNPLFAELSRATLPNIRTERRVEGTCASFSPGSCTYWEDWGGEGEGEPEGEGNEGEGEAGGGVEVLREERVGPFDTVLLNADDAEALIQWLQDNSYDIPLDMAPALQPYLGGAHLVAMKLTKGAQTGDLQPIVIEHSGDTAMIPIRLTSLAATDDMPMTIWTVGDAVGVPITWPLIEPNEGRLAWGGCSTVGCAPEWRTLVGAAADEAGGRGFVLESTSAPAEAIAELDRALDGELAQLIRGGRGCLQAREFLSIMSDPAFIDLLEEVVLAPAGVSLESYLSCPCCNSERMRGLMQDFADAVTERYLPELRAVLARLGEATTLTRLSTEISPDEMTIDPVFTLDPSQPKASERIQATWVTECSPETLREDALVRLELDDGNVIGVVQPVGWSWSFAPDEQAPAARRIVQPDGEGGREVIVDNTVSLERSWAARATADRERVGAPPKYAPEQLSCDGYCCGPEDKCRWANNGTCDCGGTAEWDFLSGDCARACVPGKASACMCSDGRAGAQVCDRSGSSYAACNCTGEILPGDTVPDDEIPAAPPTPGADDHGEIGPGPAPGPGRSGADDGCATAGGEPWPRLLGLVRR